MSQQQPLSLVEPKSPPASSASTAIPALSRDEMNLAEFPLAVLSTRSNPKVKTLEFTDTQRLKNGELIQREWIITGADKFGLPTSTDDDVVLGLMRLTMDQGFRERKVYFTRYELLKILRWSTEGRSYSRLVKSLDRLSGVRVRAANAFYDNQSKAYQTCNFGIIDAYEINDERGTRHFSNGEPPRSFFIWSEVLFDSFKSGFIKKLDLELYFSLKSAVSRRLYRYLDKHFYYRASVELSLMTLAFEKLGLSRNYKYVSSIKQQLQPGLDELMAVGFLSDYSYEGRGVQTSIRFKSGEAVSSTSPKSRKFHDANQRRKAQAQAKPVSEVQSPLAKQLVDRGLTAKQVHNLLSGRSDAEFERIVQIIHHYDRMVATKDSRVNKNPVGFLYKAVEAPFRFKLPDSQSSFARSHRPRPERVAARKQQKKDELDDQRRREYRAYMSKEVASLRRTMNEGDLADVQSLIESRMSALKNILDQEKYQEAVRGCVEEEIAKQNGLPAFEEWQRAQHS